MDVLYRNEKCLDELVLAGLRWPSWSAWSKSF